MKVEGVMLVVVFVLVLACGGGWLLCLAFEMGPVPKPETHQFRQAYWPASPRNLLFVPRAWDDRLVPPHPTYSPYLTSPGIISSQILYFTKC